MDTPPPSAVLALDNGGHLGQSATVGSGKDTTIEMLLSRLREDLGTDAFDVVDHWATDRYAVGVTRPADHRFLVYISTDLPERSVYAYQVERPPSGGEMPYEADPMVDVATYVELLDAVRVHLTP